MGISRHRLRDYLKHAKNAVTLKELYSVHRLASYDVSLTYADFEQLETAMKSYERNLLENSVGHTMATLIA